MNYYLCIIYFKQIIKHTKKIYIIDGSQICNRLIPLHYSHSTRFENVKKSEKYHKNHYLVITFFMVNFWWASDETMPQHNPVWILNLASVFIWVDFVHILTFSWGCWFGSNRWAWKIGGSVFPQILYYGHSSVIQQV